MNELSSYMLISAGVGTVLGAVAGAAGGWRALLIVLVAALAVGLFGFILFASEEVRGAGDWGAIMGVVLLILGLIVALPGVILHLLGGALAIHLFYKKGRVVPSRAPARYPSTERTQPDK